MLRAGLAWLLGASAWHKLRDRTGFRAAIAGYELLPPPAVPALAAALPALEIGLAAALLVPAAGAPAALGAGALLAGYAFAMAAALARGRQGIACGCGGPAGRFATWSASTRRNWPS